MKRARIFRSTKIIFACAWCPSSTHTRLKDGETYSHGICKNHKEQLLQKGRVQYI